jgi:hypothetical protein
MSIFAQSLKAVTLFVAIRSSLRFARHRREQLLFDIYTPTDVTFS